MRTMLALLLAAAATACAAPAADPAPEPPPAPEAARPAPPVAPGGEGAALVRGGTEFGIDLYRRLGAKPGNVFVSPLSISTAFGLAEAGAVGETAAEIRNVLRYGLSQAQLHPAMGALVDQLRIDKPGRRLAIANALWVQRGFPFRADYQALVAKHYGAPPRQLDFQGDPPGSAGEINGWAEKNTAGRIKNLLSPTGLSRDTRAVLTNTVYFKGDWLKPFHKAATRPENFYPHGVPGPEPVPGGMKPPIQLPFMTQTGHFRHLDEGSFSAVELPYKGGELSMVMFLPRGAIALPEFEAKLDAAQLGQWLDQLYASEPRRVLLEIPKLTLQTRYSLVPELGAMGMRLPFTPQADFSGMSAGEGLLISDVIHQTFLLVDETGTEAAAATGIIAVVTSAPAPPIVFRADHPYFFLIRDNRSGSILFMGRIAAPSPA